MAMVATDIKGMLSISIKSRHDSYTDQYNRMFMVKILLACSLVMGISWFQDSIHCIVPDSHKVSGDFISSACWIQGVYVYRELINEMGKVGYFGIPKDINNDGIYIGRDAHPGLHLCSTKKVIDKITVVNPYCRPMTKTFYLQYQWMPFFVASLSILFYLPYIAFRTANSDLISLKNNLKSEEKSEAGKIAKHYFNHRTNPPRTMILRVIFNILIKILYLVANLVALLGLDSLLNGQYVGFGSKWVAWNRLNNTMAYDYMGMRDHPKPGNSLLPPFGYCEVHEVAKELVQSKANLHKVICELSQNILYQYCLIVLWFALIFGIVISVIGIVLLIVHYVIGIFGIRKRGQTGKKLYKALTFRELEYLEFIRKRDVMLYGEVMEKLREDILGPNAPLDDEFPPRNSGGESAPLYPHLSEKDKYDHKGPGYNL
ncbi:innexin inx2-like [Hydractinia symbiolongicarpus]|uniref:innexin inx2-like n=1 Tax=Hydractinia symbiolongicarpus TaxID=13093 RepID=UPI00254CA9BD|nr:innexin inx2-like [Hydractinia symbiolongicarpus]